MAAFADSVSWPYPQSIKLWLTVRNVQSTNPRVRVPSSTIYGADEHVTVVRSRRRQVSVQRRRLGHLPDDMRQSSLCSTYRPIASTLAQLLIPGLSQQNVVGEIFDALKVACKRMGAPLKSEPSYGSGQTGYESVATVTDAQGSVSTVT
jgi:hypothetical protein